MDNSQYSRELDHLERLLTLGPRPEPSTALRQRVLDDFRAELHHRRLNRLRVQLLREQKRANGRFAVACAVTLLVAVGLSIGVMHAAGIALRPPASAPTVAEVAWQLQQLSPDISPRDSLVQATLRHIGPEATCRDVLKNIFADNKSHHDP
jgi:hypothetical protein